MGWVTLVAILRATVFWVVMSFHQIASAGLLDGYEDSLPTHTMICWRGDKWERYEVVGNKIRMNGLFDLPILERKGDVFATKYFGGTLILDFQRLRITMKEMPLMFGLDNAMHCKKRIGRH